MPNIGPTYGITTCCMITLGTVAKSLPRHVFAEPGVGAGDEERVVRHGFQLTASTAARMSGTSLRVV